MGKALERLNIDQESLKSLELELGGKISDVLDEAAAKCDKIIKQTEKECNRILGSYGARSIIQHNINYKLLEKNRK